MKQSVWETNFLLYCENRGVCVYMSVLDHLVNWQTDRQSVVLSY